MKKETNERVTHRSGVNLTMSCKGHLAECWVSTQPIKESFPSLLAGEDARRAGTGFPHGFTLIELLVVVLIIGILAAVALPQYQLAVTKSRYATLKATVKAILTAEEVYYLANGDYTTNFDNLDLQAPGGWLNTSTDSTKHYPWGYCQLSKDTDVYIQCANTKIKLRYFATVLRHPSQRRLCVADNTDTSSIQAKVCQIETGRPNNLTEGGRNYIAWRY